MKKSLVGLALSAVVFTGMCSSVSYAYTDDTHLLGTLEDTRGPIYDYLNSNNFHFYNKSNYTYTYIQKDNSLFILITDGISGGSAPLIGHNGWLGGIMFLKPGHKTNKGIAVGMKLDDLVKAYGNVYPMNRSDVYKNDINTGCYRTGTYTYKSSWGDRKFSYFEIAYRDRKGGEIDFLVDQQSKKIRAISFQFVPASDYPYFWRSPSSWAQGWGLWRFILPEMEDNPIKSAWNNIEGIFKR